jgi:hypothetical protein
MDTNPFAGLMEAKPFAGLMEAKPFAGLMEATTFLTATLRSLFDPHRFQATFCVINFHNIISIISQHDRSDLPDGLSGNAGKRPDRRPIHLPVNTSITIFS